MAAPINNTLPAPSYSLPGLGGGGSYGSNINFGSISTQPVSPSVTLPQSNTAPVNTSLPTPQMTTNGVSGLIQPPTVNPNAAFNNNVGGSMGTPVMNSNLSAQYPAATTYGANSSLTPLNSSPLGALSNGTASLLGAPQTPQTPSYPGTSIPLVPPVGSTNTGGVSGVITPQNTGGTNNGTTNAGVGAANTGGAGTTGTNTGGGTGTTQTGTTNPQQQQQLASLQSAIQALIQQGQNGSPAYNQAVQNLADYNQKVAQEFQGFEQTPSDMEFTTGREQALQRSITSQQAALQGAVTQQQQQQQQQLQALESAAGLSTPANQFAQVGQGTTVLNSQGQPIVTTPVIGPVGTQSQYSVPPTTYNGGQATTLPGGTPSGSGAGNTPFTGGQAAGQAGLGEQYVQNNATIQAAQQVQQKINADITQNNLNPSSANVLNAALQWANGKNLSSTPYANLANDLADYAGTIGPIIGQLGAQTDAKTFMAQQMTDAQASGQTLMQVLDNLNSLMLSKNAAIAAAGQGGAGQGQTAQGQSAANAAVKGANGGAPITSAVFPGVTWTMNPQTGQWTSTST